jgi:hypothetical protein
MIVRDNEVHREECRGRLSAPFENQAPGHRGTSQQSIWFSGDLGIVVHRVQALTNVMTPAQNRPYNRLSVQNRPATGDDQPLRQILDGHTYGEGNGLLSTWFPIDQVKDLAIGPQRLRNENDTLGDQATPVSRMWNVNGGRNSGPCRPWTFENF